MIASLPCLVHHRTRMINSPIWGHSHRRKRKQQQTGRAGSRVIKRRCTCGRNDRDNGLLPQVSEHQGKRLQHGGGGVQPPLDVPLQPGKDREFQG